MTDPAELVSRVRAALDDRERWARGATGPLYSANPDGTRLVVDPAAVLRLVGALREIAERHQPVECGNRSPEHSAQHIVCLADCSGDFPCPDFRALAHGLGIDTEETA